MNFVHSLENQSTTVNAANSATGSNDSKVKTELSVMEFPLFIRQAIAATSSVTMKRNLSDEYEVEAKKHMSHHSSGSDHGSSAKTLPAPKFCTAATMMRATNIDTNTIPEITDEELLEMALLFEKQHPQ